MSRRSGGSKYLYEPFDAASARLEAHERVFDERWHGLERRLQAIEGMLERLERRLWLAVYGAAGMFSADVVYGLVTRA